MWGVTYRIRDDTMTVNYKKAHQCTGDECCNHEFALQFEESLKGQGISSCQINLFKSLIPRICLLITKPEKGLLYFVSCKILWGIEVGFYLSLTSLHPLELSSLKQALSFQNGKLLPIGNCYKQHEKKHLCVSLNNWVWIPRTHTGS